MAAERLPSDVVLKVFKELKGTQLARSACVCQSWRSTVDDNPGLWRRACKKEHRIFVSNYERVPRDVYIKEHISKHQVEWEDLAQELDYGRELLEQLYQERDNKRIFLQVSQHHMQVLQLQLDCVRSAQHMTHLVLHLLAAMRRSLQQPTHLWRKVESALQEVAHIRRDVQVNRMQWLSSASQLQRQAQVAACLDQLQQRNDDMAVLLRGLAQKVQEDGEDMHSSCGTSFTRDLRSLDCLEAALRGLLRMLQHARCAAGQRPSSEFSTRMAAVLRSDQQRSTDGGADSTAAGEAAIAAAAGYAGAAEAPAPGAGTAAPAAPAAPAAAGAAPGAAGGGSTRSQLLCFVRSVVKALCTQFEEHGAALGRSRDGLLLQLRNCREHIMEELTTQEVNVAIIKQEGGVRELEGTTAGLHAKLQRLLACAPELARQAAEERLMMSMADTAGSSSSSSDSGSEGSDGSDLLAELQGIVDNDMWADHEDMPAAGAAGLDDAWDLPLPLPQLAAAADDDDSSSDDASSSGSSSSGSASSRSSAPLPDYLYDILDEL